MVSERRLLAETPQGRFGMTLAGRCPTMAATETRLLAPHGWVCGERPDREFVSGGPTTCAILAVAPVSARDFAAEIRAHDTQRFADTTTLEAVEVKAVVPRHRGFARSSAYCFNPRHTRSWSRDGRGLLVTTSPRRSGGHRLYRVEVGRSCPELDLAQRLEFRSGIGGAICGNPGDIALAARELPEALPSETLTESGLLEASIFSQLATLSGCPIVAVYPVSSGTER
jgi:hypothetical protein